MAWRIALIVGTVFGLALGATAYVDGQPWWWLAAAGVGLVTITVALTGFVSRISGGVEELSDPGQGRVSASITAGMAVFFYIVLPICAVVGLVAVGCQEDGAPSQTPNYNPPASPPARDDDYYDCDPGNRFVPGDC